MPGQGGLAGQTKSRRADEEKTAEGEERRN